LIKRIGPVRKFYRKVLYRDLDKVYAKSFMKKQMPKINKKFLDVGMGFGLDLIDKYRKGYECFGIDFDKSRVKKTIEMFEKNGLKTTLKVGSVTKIPFKANFFDEVVCSHVIEHVRDDNLALKEIYRVMKRGGILHLRVPNKNNLHTRFHTLIGSNIPYTDNTHVREYEKDNILKLLKKPGFVIKNVKQSGFFPPLGLKFFMLADHYISSSRLMLFLGKKFPNSAAEIIITARK